MSFSLPRALAALSCLLALVCPTRAQSAWREDQQIHWQRSLDDALAIARAEQRPMLLVLHTDAESACERILKEEYRDPAFVASTRSFVCAVGSLMRHNPRDFDDQGRRIPCPRLGEVTCGEHIALEPAIFD